MLLRLAALVLLAGCGPSLQDIRLRAERRELQLDAPVQAEVSRDIAAPIETVWQIFSDVKAWPSWNDDAAGATLHGPFAAGTAFDYGASTQHHLVLAQVSAPTGVSFYGTFAGYKGVTVWEFTALSPTTTRATARESNDGFLISVFYSRAQLAQHLDLWLQRLGDRARTITPPADAPIRPAARN